VWLVVFVTAVVDTGMPSVVTLLKPGVLSQSQVLLEAFELSTSFRQPNDERGNQDSHPEPPAHHESSLALRTGLLGIDLLAKRARQRVRPGGPH
jgi:hypothetical protein